MQSFEGRANLIFGQARERILEDCARMHADHSAKVRLGSGSTARQAILIFQKQMNEALGQVLREASKLIEHRGKAWGNAMTAISNALEAELSGAQELLAPSFKLAGIDAPSAETAVQELITKAGSDLRAELSGFSEGWTAPQPKRWPDRHPVAYAILLLAAGSVITWVVAQLMK